MEKFNFPGGLLYNCDCFDLLRTLANDSVDLVIVDLPYVVSNKKTNFEHGGKAKFKKIKIPKYFGPWDEKVPDLPRLMPELYRVLRSGGTLIAFYDWKKLSYLVKAVEASKFRMLRLLLWLKPNPLPHNQKAFYLSNGKEFAVACVKGSKPTFHRKYHKGIFDEYGTCHDKPRIHPTQKPLLFMQELIKIHSNVGDTVLDPMSGGATTAVAARNLGRKFVGCEIDPKYYRLGCGRLET